MDVTLDTRNVTVPATFRNRLARRVSGFFIGLIIQSGSFTLR